MAGLTVSPSSTGGRRSGHLDDRFHHVIDGSVGGVGRQRHHRHPSHRDDVGSFSGGTVTDTTTGQTLDIDDDCSVVSGTTVSCPLYYYDNTVNAGDVMSVVLNGVTNPTTTGTATITVSTTSDTKTTTKAFTVTATQAVSRVDGDALDDGGRCSGRLDDRLHHLVVGRSRVSGQHGHGDPSGGDRLGLFRRRPGH